MKNKTSDKIDDVSMKNITLETVIYLIKCNLELLENDFASKKYGDKAKLLHKHYSMILSLLEKCECK